jgi:hypothetical protein
MLKKERTMRESGGGSEQKEGGERKVNTKQISREGYSIAVHRRSEDGLEVRFGVVKSLLSNLVEFC